MANQAEKIRDINSVGWDGLDANVHHLRINDMDVQSNLIMHIENVFRQLKARRCWNI